MKAIKLLVMIMVVWCSNCSGQHLKGARSTEELIFSVISSVKNGSIVGIERLLLDGDKLEELDRNIVLSAKNGCLKEIFYVSIEDARKIFLDTQFLDANEKYYVICLKWDSPCEGGIALVTQFFYTVNENDRFYIKLREPKN